MFGVELSQISLLYYLTYVASAGNIKNLIEPTEYTAQEYKIKVWRTAFMYKYIFSNILNLLDHELLLGIKVENELFIFIILQSWLEYSA